MAVYVMLGRMFTVLVFVKELCISNPDKAFYNYRSTRQADQEIWLNCML